MTASRLMGRNDMATALHCEAGMDYLLDHRGCIDGRGG